jgi:hypothetical protein
VNACIQPEHGRCARYTREALPLARVTAFSSKTYPLPGVTFRGSIYRLSCTPRAPAGKQPDRLSRSRSATLRRTSLRKCEWLPAARVIHFFCELSFQPKRGGGTCGFLRLAHRRSMEGCWALRVAAAADAPVRSRTRAKEHCACGFAGSVTRFEFRGFGPREPKTEDQAGRWKWKLRLTYRYHASHAGPAHT